MTHECEKHWDGLEVVTTKKACPLLNCPAVSPGSPPALPGGPQWPGRISPWTGAGGHDQQVGRHGCTLLVPTPRQWHRGPHRTRLCPARTAVASPVPHPTRTVSGRLCRGGDADSRLPWAGADLCTPPTLPRVHLRDALPPPGPPAAGLQFLRAREPRLLPGQLRGHHLRVREPAPAPPRGATSPKPVSPAPLRTERYCRAALSEVQRGPPAGLRGVPPGRDWRGQGPAGGWAGVRGRWPLARLESHSSVY